MRQDELGLWRGGADVCEGRGYDDVVECVRIRHLDEHIVGLSSVPDDVSAVECEDRSIKVERDRHESERPVVRGHNEMPIGVDGVRTVGSSRGIVVMQWSALRRDIDPGDRA